MEGWGAVVAACVALVVAIGGYLQFVLRRAVFPCVEFDVELGETLYTQGQRVIELVLHVHNVGPGVGYVQNVESRVMYRLHGESGVRADGVEPNFEHTLEYLQTPDSGSEDEGTVGDAGTATRTTKSRSIPWITSPKPIYSRNFIQPGVTQRYRKPLAIPSDARGVHVWASFQYGIQVGSVAWKLASYLAERPETKNVPYHVRRTFALEVPPR